MSVPDSPSPGGLFTVGESLALLVAPRGRLAQQSALALRVGGAESNVAIAVARLGAAATWCGRIGDDGFGELVLTTLRGQGVLVRSIPDSVSTSLMVKEQRSAAVTRVTYYRASGPGSRLRPADLPERDIVAAGVLHLTGITPALSNSALETVHAAIDIALAHRVPVSFDVNYRSALWPADTARNVLLDIVRRVQVVFAGEDEAALLLGEVAHPSEAARGIAEFGASEVLIKRGAHGVLAWDGAVERDMRAVPVIAMDPVGAGDAFAAGYLAEKLAGETAERALLTAVHCGAYTVTGFGDWENTPTRADLDLSDAPAGTVLR